MNLETICCWGKQTRLCHVELAIGINFCWLLFVNKQSSQLLGCAGHILIFYCVGRKRARLCVEIAARLQKGHSQGATRPPGCEMDGKPGIGLEMFTDYKAVRPKAIRLTERFPNIKNRCKYVQVFANIFKYLQIL